MEAAEWLNSSRNWEIVNINSKKILCAVDILDGSRETVSPEVDFSLRIDLSMGMGTAVEPGLDISNIDPSAWRLSRSLLDISRHLLMIVESSGTFGHLVIMGNCSYGRK
jgi:hypothetical protein